jgi:hypothetical protein
MFRPEYGIPPELDTIVARCMAKQPEDRYASAADLYAALSKVPGYPVATGEARRKVVPVPRRPESLTTDERYGNMRGALRQLAEALVDRVKDGQLVSSVAELRAHEQTLAGLEAAHDALEHEAEALREATGDREQRLRDVEKHIAVVAEMRAQALEKLIAVYDALERHVETLIPTFAGDSMIDALAQRLALVKRHRAPAGSEP